MNKVDCFRKFRLIGCLNDSGITSENYKDQIMISFSECCNAKIIYVESDECCPMFVCSKCGVIQ